MISENHIEIDRAYTKLSIRRVEVGDYSPTQARNSSHIFRPPMPENMVLIFSIWFWMAIWTAHPGFHW